MGFGVEANHYRRFRRFGTPEHPRTRTSELSAFLISWPLLKLISHYMIYVLYVICYMTLLCRVRETVCVCVWCG